LHCTSESSWLLESRTGQPKKQRAAQQGDEADEAFGGMVARMDMPPHARAGLDGRGHRFAAYPRCSADAARRQHGLAGAVADLGREVAMLDAIKTVILLAAYAAFAVGSIWLIIRAFRTGVLWGLACLFISPMMILFAVTHWSAGRDPLLLQVSGFLLFFVGACLR
jgi:hypothetical protein